MTAGPDTERLLHDPSLVGTGLSRAWTTAIDDWLRAIVSGVDEVAGVSLAATGGYGRGELSPFSDLDLLLIHDGSGAVAEVAERVWYPVWDSGIKLGHAVRTIDEALDLSATDLETATSLLDMRWLGGDQRMVKELSEKADRLWVDRADRMLPMIAESARERHARFGEVAFLLEPDLKVARGGLRDVHSLRWMHRADPALLIDSESTGLAGPHDTLLAARVELHRRVGRPNDVLALQEQDEVAPALGYADADYLMADIAAAGAIGCVDRRCCAPSGARAGHPSPTFPQQARATWPRHRGHRRHSRPCRGCRRGQRPCPAAAGGLGGRAAGRIRQAGRARSVGRQLSVVTRPVARRGPRGVRRSLAHWPRLDPCS